MPISFDPTVRQYNVALNETQQVNNTDIFNNASAATTEMRQNKIDEAMKQSAKAAVELDSFWEQQSAKITAANKAAVKKMIAKAKANREEDADDEGEE
jgi:hypothetical protein